MNRFRSLSKAISVAFAVAVLASISTLAAVALLVLTRQPAPLRMEAVPPAAGGTDAPAAGVPAAADGPAYATGWVPPSAEALAENLDPARTQHFDQTPAGRAALADDEPVLLYRNVRKARGPPGDDSYPSINQGPVGCCVGAGNKHAIDALAATQVVLGGRREVWRPVSAEVVYGGSRVEVGGGRIRGDGSTGAWAARFVKEWGVVPMDRYPEADLTTFSPARARQFGSAGVPPGLEALAREHPVRDTALVKTWADVSRAIRQGCAVPVCSNVGFNGRRDRDGFIRASGTWAHCMALVGVRGGPRPGALCLNSWGDEAHAGPVWPEDMPKAAFWIDADTVTRMVSQGDSFAYSSLVGFPDRRIDWRFLAAPARRPDVALRLAPDRERLACLAW